MHIHHHKPFESEEIKGMVIFTLGLLMFLACVVFSVVVAMGAPT